MNHDDYWRSVLWAAHGHFCNKSESDWKTAKDIFIGGKLAPCDSRLIDRFALRTPIAYKQPIKTDSQAIHLYLGQRSNKHPISFLYLLMILNLWQKIEYIPICNMFYIYLSFLFSSGQGCIFRLTCSYPELTKDHVLTSAYAKIFRTVTRNAVNKSVWRKKDRPWLPLNKHAMNIW